MIKLYEQDPYIDHFSACVLSCTPVKNGFEVCLDQTAFYPEGGGQPWDTGTLDHVQVLEVHQRDGNIIHLCNAPLEPGCSVKGQINWPRRFDLMQQHSGEHIVSGIAHARWGCENVGFHMGSDVVTIDFDRVLTRSDLAWLENMANQYIWSDRPVSISYPTPDELETLAYRSKKALSGSVRIVSFPGADTCACCGTHVSSSAQIGFVKLLSVQKFRDGVRIELVCGGRALEFLNRNLEQNHIVSNLLSAQLFDTSSAVQRLLNENNSLKSRIQIMEDHHFQNLAQTYLNAGNVLLFEDGLSANSLRRLCDAVLHACQGRCACFSLSPDGSFQYAIGSPNANLRDFTNAMNQALNGQGGGKPDFVQGRLRANRSEIERWFASQT